MMIIVFHAYLWGAYLSNYPVIITQPNGMKIESFITGDEYYNWLHDEDGYTIIQHPKTGYYCFAILDGDDLIASEYIVGEVSPKVVGLDPYINISGEKIMEKVSLFFKNKPPNSCDFNPKLSPGTLKTLNNIVIYIRFSDQDEFLPIQNFYTSIFNDITPYANSMRNYFQETTYLNWDIISHFYPTGIVSSQNPNVIFSYQDPHTRAYYCPYNAVTNPIGYNYYSEGAFRLDSMFYNAIDYIKNQVPAYLNIDCDNNGCVDNVCFVIRGEIDERGEMLYPCRSWLMKTNYINGKEVDSYNLQIEEHLEDLYYGRTCVLAHEMCHTLGLPDLYHKKDKIHPVGIWDIMASYRISPPHMSAYMKYRYGGWIPSIPSITHSGTYTLQLLVSPLNSTKYPNCYKIPIAGSSQYLVVEYRKHRPNMFDGCLPGSDFGSSGLIIYRIDESLGGNIGGTGPGGVNDEVYVFRKDGTIYSDGNYNNAYFSESTGRTIFSNVSNPNCFFTTNPPPASHNGNIFIKNIKENSAKTEISFDVRFCDTDNITISNTSSLPAITNASNSVKTMNTVVVKNIDKVIFEAGNWVELNSGFEVQLGGTFEININECGEK